MGWVLLPSWLENRLQLLSFNCLTLRMLPQSTFLLYLVLALHVIIFRLCLLSFFMELTLAITTKRMFKWWLGGWLPWELPGLLGVVMLPSTFLWRMESLRLHRLSYLSALDDVIYIPLLWWHLCNEPWLFCNTIWPYMCEMWSWHTYRWAFRFLWKWGVTQSTTMTPLSSSFKS